MPKHSAGQWIWAALGLVVLGLALWGIHLIAGQVTWAQIVADMRGVSPHLLMVAAVSTALSYLVLVGYDWLAVAHLGYRLPVATLAAASFGSFTMSHALGLTVLTGGTVRYRIYTRAGVKPLDVALIIALCGWTFWLGIIVVAGLGLLVSPHLGTPFRQFAPHAERWAGVLLLAGAAAYVLLAMLWRQPIRLFSYSFTLPDARETLLQIAIGAVDLAFAGTALYVLLPAAATPDLLTFLTIYAVAMVVGALSHAPGGLGVFEGVVLLLLHAKHNHNVPEVLAAMVLFRLIYTYIPFLLGLVVIGGSELVALRQRRAGGQPAGATPSDASSPPTLPLPPARQGHQPPSPEPQ